MHLSPSHLPILPPGYPAAAAHQLSLVVSTRMHSPALAQLAHPMHQAAGFREASGFRDSSLAPCPTP